MINHVYCCFYTLPSREPWEEVLLNCEQALEGLPRVFWLPSGSERKEGGWSKTEPPQNWSSALFAPMPPAKPTNPLHSFQHLPGIYDDPFPSVSAWQSVKITRTLIDHFDQFDQITRIAQNGNLIKVIEMINHVYCCFYTLPSKETREGVLLNCEHALEGVSSVFWLACGSERKEGGWSKTEPPQNWSSALFAPMPPAKPTNPPHSFQHLSGTYYDPFPSVFAWESGKRARTLIPVYWSFWSFWSNHKN